MASAWRVAEMGWGVTVLGWFLSPIIGLLLNKFLSYLGFDASQKLQDLEITTIRNLKLTLSEVEEQRILREARKERDNVKILNGLASMLRSALYEAEDILDLIDYHQIEKKVVGDGESHDCSWLRRLYDAVGTCVAGCSRSWLRRGRSAALLRWAQQSLCWLGRCVRATLRRSGALLPISCAPSVSWVQRIRCWSGSFDFRNCCRSIFAWSASAIAVARSYRNWSYEEVGITSYQDDGIPVDSFLPTIARWKLKKRIERLENTVTEVKKSDLLNQERSSALKIIANMNRRVIRSTAARKVFGRDKERDMITKMLREGPDDYAPSSSSSKCYSAIGIYGIAGSGKTTLAQHVCDYEKEAEGTHFDPIMCVHVSETFRVDDIFRDMLEEITQDRHSDITGARALKAKLMEELRGRRFLLVLDDLWVKDENYQEREELLSPLNVGSRGSKILVTARTENAVRALGAKKPIAISDLDEDQYFKMFMHYADMNDVKYEHVGRKIAEKLGRSPIAAVTVAARLRGIANIEEWESTAKLDQLNGAMGALWWSYQQLDVDVRRCFEYCSIFPRRYELERDELVRMWIAQGFVKTNNATDDMEDVGHSYCHELLSCSFLQLRTRFGSETEYYTIHDLLHDLAKEVAGSHCFRIENGWKEEVPRDVRHLFVTTCNRALLAEKIFKLENLRTLIIHSFTKLEEIEDEDFERMFTTLRKLRILSVDVRRQSTRFSVPASIGQLKHIRYLAIMIDFDQTRYTYELILPRTFSKLYLMQVLDFGCCRELVFDRGQDMMSNLINLRHIHTSTLSHLNLPNIIRLTSLQTLPTFGVRKEPGYELRQLRDLNKLRGRLRIDGLENVGSREEALEANLAGKVRLTRLDLKWDRWNSNCSADLEAEILEGLCPPMGLEKLRIQGYEGSRYPDWMVGNNNGPKNLRQLLLSQCGPLGAIPDRNEFFLHLRGLALQFCNWDALPDNMEHLTSLKELFITGCWNIRSLPRLPQSLEHFQLFFCDDVFMRSCKTIGDPNWQNIEHVPNKYIDYEDLEENDCDDLNEDPEQGKLHQHPIASQGGQHLPHHGGVGASNLGQTAGRGGYHPGFNPSYHPGANRGWQGGGRRRRGARGGHAPHGFAGRGAFGNIFSGAGRGSGGRGVGRGHGGQEWSANPLASRSLPSNAPSAIAPVSSAANPLPEDYEDLEENDCDDLNEDPEQEEAFDDYDEDCE